MVFNLKSITKADIEKQYKQHPSFSNHLPWQEWSDNLNMMLLEDCFSVGSAIEIRDIGCEGITESVIKDLYEKITQTFSNALPLHQQDPWVMQIFVQDDITLLPLYKKLESYISERNGLDNDLTQEFLKVQKEHFELMCREEGMFYDPNNNMAFKGRVRRIRIVLYRRYSEPNRKKDINVIKEHKEVLALFTSKLRQIGISVRVMQGEHMYEWFVRWFNPKPKLTNGSVDDLLEKYPYLNTKKPAGWQFDKDVFFNSIESTDKHWIFDDLLHTIILFKDLTGEIDVGVISRERSIGAKAAKYSLLDKLPIGSIYTIQLVFESRSAIENHLDSIEKAAIGKGQIINRTRDNCNAARDEMDKAHILIRSTEGIYLYANNEDELRKHETNISALMEHSMLNLYSSSVEKYPLDNYMRLLPFNFNYEFDKKCGRSNYKYPRDVAKLLPIYGRSRGDGQNPLYMFFNRGGEPFIFDPFNKNFKQSNSHQLWLGSTGAGKSVQLNDMIIRVSAIYNPHIIALEVGGSFDLSAKYLAHHGRKVRSIKYVKGRPEPQNPYAEAYIALDIIEREAQKLREELEHNSLKVNEHGITETLIDKRIDKLETEIRSLDKKVSLKELEDEEDRDILNEMLLATRLAITGGDPKEEETIDRTDMAYINKVLIQSAKKAREVGKYQMIMSDVQEGFYDAAKIEKSPDLKQRLETFALRLDLYINDQVRGSFINRFSEPLEEYDFLHIDFGFLQQDSYQDLLNIICITLLSKILTLAEKNKATGRFTLLTMDEFHIFSSLKTFMLFMILLAKVGRKFGLWLVLATQNVEDLNTDQCKKLLSIIETWVCFAIEKGQVSLISELKSLSEEIKHQLANTMQQKPLYTEGVLLGKKYTGIFRCVPPRLSLALAMSEQDERTERMMLQKQHNIDELSAVAIIAKRLTDVRVEQSEDRDFYD